MDEICKCACAKNISEALLRKDEIAVIDEIQLKKSGKYTEIVGRRVRELVK